MKRHLITALLLSISGTTFAQMILKPSQVSIEDSGPERKLGLNGKNRPDLDLEIDIDRKKSKSQTFDVRRREGLPNLKQSPNSFAGGQEGNGGDSAVDKKTNQRKLLDLIENDELEYFIPNPTLYNHTIPLELARLLQIMRAECNAFQGRPFDCPLKPTGRSESILNLADYIFIDVVIRSYGIESLLTSGWYNRIYTEDYAGLVDLEKQFGLEPVAPLKWAFVDFDLTEINDEGLIHIDSPETKRQLAVQRNGVVVIGRSEFNALDDVSKASLFIHESVLRAVLLLNPNLIATHGTEPIRTLTRRLVKYFLSRESIQKYPSFPVREAYNALEIIKTK